MDPLTSPHEPALRAAVDAAYDAFGRGFVSAALEVCSCPVCMTNDTRRRIISTRNDGLPPALVREYSNSAHGVPSNLDDLKLLLPRYLDLMARDDAVDNLGVGTELSRFGDARRMHPDLFDEKQGAVLDDWARAMITHFAWAEVKAEVDLTVFHLFEVLICGGWPVSVVTGAVDAAFEDPETGAAAVAQFAKAVCSDLIYRGRGTGVDWYALRYVDDATRAAVADWLNAVAASDRLEEMATDPSLRGADWIESLVRLAGQFDPGAFPKVQT